MHILIAPNAFKHSFNATQIAAAVRIGLQKSKLQCTCECFPVGDGGDGTGRLMTDDCAGSWQRVLTQNPMGKTITVFTGMIDEDKTAVIEMADASGIRLLKRTQLDPMAASSYGTGVQVKAALDKGARKIIIAMGGSCTIDGGIGILRALGARFLNAAGNDLPAKVAALVKLRTIELSGLDKRLKRCQLVILCDVNNRLLGTKGGIRIFSPQKGASAADIQMLERAIARLAKIVLGTTGKDMTTIKYGGTAGGAAAGLYALLGAKLVNGADFFLDITGFDSALQKADLVITGEGSIDKQTLNGKAPYAVALRAKRHRVPVIAISGNVPLEKDEVLKRYFDVLLSIAHMPLDLNSALDNTSKNIIRTSRQIGDLLFLAK